MRILVCTKRDLHGAHFLNRLLPALAGHEVTGVWLSDKNRDAEDSVAELSELRFVERTLPVDLLFPLIDALPDTISALAPDATFAGLARRHRLALDVVPASDIATRLHALAPDLLIVARFSHIFDAPSIAVPRFGMLNVHPGRLPEYAGLHAPLRAVLDGADTLGCSVHWITPGIDDGPLLAVHPQALDPASCLLAQNATLYPLAIPTLLDTIAACAAGRRPPGTAQDSSRRHYRSMPTSAEFDALRRRGLRLWCANAYPRWLARYLPPGLPMPPIPREPR